MQKTNMPAEAYAPIRGHAGQTPAAIALLAPGRKPLSFDRLWDQVESTRENLTRCGVVPGDVVALALPDGPEMITAVLGAGLAGACAPLNPALTAAEFAGCFSSLEPAALLAPAGSDSAAIVAAQAAGVPVLDMCPMTAEAAGVCTITARGDAPPQRRRNAADAAILLHTSATTGKPKLVPLSHANLGAISRNMRMALHLTREDRFLSLMPLFHLQGLASVLAQLSAGGSVICVPGFDPAPFLSWMSEFRPTWYTAGPTLHRAILTLLGGVPPPCALRFVRSIGAPLTPELFAAAERALGVPVIEGYGLTETGTVTSNPLPPRPRVPGSVGVRLETEVGIFDLSGRSLPDEQEGEIAVRGPAVTSAYLDPADANLAAFRDGWLRTGDRGRFDENGYLFITGRLKELINRGGEKIMPQEVDRALAAHGAVAEAAAFAAPHATLGEDILAAVVLRPGASVSESALQDFAAGRIARFKVPRRILFLEQIPKGATGKPNRAALAAQFGAAAGKAEPETKECPAQAPCPRPRADVMEAPRTQLERRLAALWAEVLGFPEFGCRDNFFELGGNSLMAAHMLVRVGQSFGKNLSMEALFQAPTIQGLATLLSEPGAAALAPRIVPMQPEGSKPPFFMVRPLPIFRPLAHRLPHDRPFLGVALPERQQLPEHYDLTDIARELVRTVRRQQLSGPYILGGWCADGVVAYEMAQQLEAAGDRVALLVLFDSPNPAYLKGLSRGQALKRKFRFVVWNVRFHLAGLRQLGKSEIPGYLRQRAAALIALAKERSRSILSPSKPSAHEPRDSAWRPSGLRPRIRGYQPRAFGGRLVFFRSAAWRHGSSEDPSFGWGAFVGDRLASYRIPGDHMTIFLEPNVRLLAEKLAAHLAEMP